jgi:hypothetical protein
MQVQDIYQMSLESVFKTFFVIDINHKLTNITNIWKSVVNS